MLIFFLNLPVIGGGGISNSLSLIVNDMFFFSLDLNYETTGNFVKSF